MFPNAMSRPSLIAFTPATDSSDLWKDGQQQPQPEKPEPVLDGAAARAFYEALIADESSSPKPQRAGPVRGQKRRKRRGTREAAAVAAGASGQGRPPPPEDDDKMTQWILLAAQNGDLTELRRLLEPREAGGAGGNINARDAFWWTPLMCAARAGRAAAVRYLLDRGAAWVGVCELGGRDAAQLAEEAGFPEVARMVRESRGEARSPENQSRSPPAASQFCEDCGAHFEDSNHRTSTAHLLSLSRSPHPSNLPLGVPTSSPGFRLLLRGGWEPGMGLGPRGEGRANPIPTILKQDQEGLGYRPAPQPRVTHFPARDTRAVSGRERVPRVATLSQRENRKREEKDRAWERNLRLYMNLEL